jgi:hypothetical protein
MNSRSHNSAYSRLMVLSDLGQNSVAPAGRGSLRLVNGQVGIFRVASKTADGVAAVNGLDAYGKNELFQIQVGTGRTQDAGNMTNKNFATIPFKREDILDVTYDTAKAPVYSEVTLGYNGTAGTGIKLQENQATTVSLKLFGEQLSYLGFRDGVAEMTFNVFSGSPDACDNCLSPCANTSCKSITSDLVDTIREHELRAGSDMGTGASIKVGDLVEVIGTYSCAPEKVAASTVTYSTLERCDEGTSEALAQVQAWALTDANLADDVVVERIAREGSTSTYQVIDPSTPAGGFVEPATLLRDGVSEVTKILTDCDTCPGGATEVPGGYVWKLVADDDDANITDGALVGALNGIAGVTTSAAHAQGRADGPLNSVTWVLVTDADPGLDAIIAAVIGINASVTSADIEVSFVGEGDNVCIVTYSATTIPWATGKSCNVFSRTIELEVDLDCGPFANIDAKVVAANAKLAELQAAFPDLSVALTTDEIGECRARYTGTQLSSPVCEDCETPEPIFPAMPDDYEFSAWSERTPAEGEITSFTVDFSAATLTADIASNDAGTGDLGVTTTGSGTGGDFNFTIRGTGTIDEVTTRLKAAGSGYAVGDTVTVDLGTAAGFGANTGNVVITITGVGGEFPDDCECGIKFVAKNAYLCPPAMLADQIGTFTPKGVKIQVSGGEAPAVLMEGYKFVTTPFRVTRHERDFDGTGWGINYMKQEKASAEYFAGISPRKSYAEGYLSGFETKLEPCVQYDKFTVKLRRNNYAGTASRRMGEEIRYIFLIPHAAGCSYTQIIDALGGSIDCEELA